MNAPPLPSLYNPRSHSDDTAFVDAFVARRVLLETLLRRLRGAEPDGLTLHHILIGPRGMGKTSLLRRIAIAIGQESELAERFIPLSFREEQYNVLTLGDFWRNCGESLAEWAEATGYPALAQRLDGALLTEAWASDEAAADQFSAEMRALGRQAVLLVDNLDLILDALPKESDWALRRRLQARGGPILIGASTHALRQAADREAAFYEFFQPAYLEPLDDRETEHCMRALAKRGGEHGAQVIHILDTQPERLRTLHTLTGGNPRVLALIYRLLGTGESAAAMADLELLLDQVTPYYKAKIEEYQSAQQKAVIDAIALHWDPVTTGDLARLTRVPATTLSPLLIRLRKDGLIETVELSGAYDGHQLAERFLNIWYLMRNGTRRTKQKMRWLVAFLMSFYSLNELTQIAARAPDRAAWQPEFRFAFDAALERHTLRATVDEMRAAAVINVAMALNDKAVARRERGDNPAALALCDEVVRRFAEIPEPGVREQVARALFTKAFTLSEIGEIVTAIAVYDDVLARIALAPELSQRERVAKVLFNKARTLGKGGDRNSEIALYDDIVTRFVDAPEPSLREPVARALIGKAFILGEMGDSAAEIALYDDVIARFADETETDIREQVATAMVNKAITLGAMGESTEAIALDNDIVTRFAHASEPELRECVARALYHKALTLRDTGQIAAAINALEQLLQSGPDSSGHFAAREFAAARLTLANMLLDWQGDIIRPEALYREAAATNLVPAIQNLAWLYVLADRLSDAHRELLELSYVDPVDFALLKAGIELAGDNFGSAMGHLAIALNSEVDSGRTSFGRGLERLLRLANKKGYGDRVLAWFEQTGFADRFAPVYGAFKAYVRSEATLLDINPEIRGPAKIIYNRLDAPRRHAAETASKQPKPQRRAPSRKRRGGL